MNSSAKAKFLSKLLNLVESENVSGLGEFLDTKNTPEDAKCLNEFCKKKWSALHLSALQLNPDLLAVILEHGADPDVLDGDGNTATLLVMRRLEVCSCQCCTRTSAKCINILGDFRADLGKTDKAGNSPLYLAAQIPSLECATVLLRNGAPLENRNHRACKMLTQEESMLRILFQRLPSIVIDVFDRALTVVGSSGIHDPDCEVAFDLSVILPSNIMDFYRGHEATDNDHGNGNNGNISKNADKVPKDVDVVASPTSKLNGISSRLSSLSTHNLIHPIQDFDFEIFKSKLKGDFISKSASFRNSFEWNSETRAKYRPKVEMTCLNDLLESRHSDFKIERAILRHPLVTVFTDVKWRSLEVIFLVYIVMQIGVLVAFTVFLFMTIFVDCPYQLYENVRNGLIKVSEEKVNVSIGHSLPTSQKLCEIQIASKVIGGYVLICTAGVAFKELQHAIMDFKEYCTDLLNYVQLLGLASITATIAIAWDSTTSYYRWFYPIASLAVAISWCQIFIQIGRFPRVALYVDMLAKITINFFRSLLIYSFILIGFAMSYCVLFPMKPNLVDIPLAIVRILTMMVGELNYESLFKDSDSDKPSLNLNATLAKNGNVGDTGMFSVNDPFAAHIWYICCVIVVTLVLMNLLVGLAVSDIQGCKQNAEINVMRRRIRYTAYLEKSYYLMTHFFPAFLKDYLRKKIAIIKPPNENTLSCFQFHVIPLDNCSMIIRPNDPKPGILSQESKNAIKYWLRHRPSQRTKETCKFGMSHGHGPGRKVTTSDGNGGQGEVGTVGSDLNEMGNSSRSASARHDLGILRIERRLKELDHKIDLLLDGLSSVATHRD